MVASPMLNRLYPREIPRYSFYRRLTGPQDQSGHKGVKKNLHSSDTQDRTRVMQPIISSAQPLGLPGPHIPYIREYSAHIFSGI